MKKSLLSFGMLACMTALLSCNNDSETASTPTDTITVSKTDTVVQTVVEPPAPVDTAAIIAFYKSEHAKVKGTHKPAAKTKKNKKVQVDSDPTFVAVDAMPAPKPTPQPAAQPAPATPAPEKEKVVIIQDKELYYFIPDEKPSFPGGEKAFDQFLSEHIEYPDAALDAYMSKTVYATVYLDNQGNVQKVDFAGERTGYGFQDEARRVLMMSPRWNPAKKDGQAVKSKVTVPINFKIS